MLTLKIILSSVLGNNSTIIKPFSTSFISSATRIMVKDFVVILTRGPKARATTYNTNISNMLLQNNNMLLKLFLQGDINILIFHESCYLPCTLNISRCMALKSPVQVSSLIMLRCTTAEEWRNPVLKLVLDFPMHLLCLLQINVCQKSLGC